MARAMNQKISVIELKRRGMGITQAQLAEKIGISTSVMSHYETGISLPSIGMAEKIAGGLECEVDDLYDMEMLRTPWSLKTL